MNRYFSLFLCLVTFNKLYSLPTKEANSIFDALPVGNFSAQRLIKNGVETSSTCSSNPEEEMTTIEIIRSSGYPAENHFVTTEDGYILNLHRIPGVLGSPAVLLHHGALDSSFGWVFMGKKQSLAYELSDKGYDVWMANARGNTYSKNHTTLTPLDPEFWNFSYHEIGIYDLPAEIDYIRSIKNDGKKIMYIGHSMGTTVFFVMASQRPDARSKVAAMFALAPAAYMDHLKGFMKLVIQPLQTTQKELSTGGKNEFFPHNIIFKFFGKCICNRPVFNVICQNCLFSAVGFNSKSFNKSMLPLLLTHVPAGTSLKTVYHFGSGVRSKKFRQYDYGPKLNFKLYNSTEPPDYELKNIQVPVAMFYGENDLLIPPLDVKRLYDELPNKIELYKIKDPDFNHIDFLLGTDASKLFHPRLFYHMQKYTNLI